MLENDLITNDLLKEILPHPSKQTRTDLFAATESSMAPCTGKCVSGECRTFV